jgi:hypothetical protein
VTPALPTAGLARNGWLFSAETARIAQPVDLAFYVVTSASPVPAGGTARSKVSGAPSTATWAFESPPALGELPIVPRAEPVPSSYLMGR